MAGDPAPSDLLENMAEGLYVVDRARAITYWNGAAEAITGYSAAEVIGRWCGDNLLNHVDEAGERLCGDRCPLVATMTDGVARQARVYAHHRDGHIVPVRVSARALRDSSGVITGAVETFTDDSRLEETEKRLGLAERLLMTDHLTGLGNRRFLEQRLAERLLESGAGTGCAVVVIDIDRFKVLNDNHGHVFGDRVLVTVGKTLAHVAGGNADVTRPGGDEFMVVTDAMSASDLESLAATLRASVAETRFADGGIAIHVTVSVGAALGRAGDAPGAVVQRADDAMLEAKRAGRNRSMMSSADERAEAAQSAPRDMPAIAAVAAADD